MTKRYKRLVIDTDVISSAGGEQARDTRSITCREFLKTVLSTGHSVVITESIMEEWKRHKSRFTGTWLSSMYARRKVHKIADPTNEQLRIKIEKRYKQIK